MQIKWTLRHHLTPVTVDKIKHDSLLRMCREGNTPALLVGVQTGTITWKSICQFLRKFRPSYITPGHIPKDTLLFFKDTCSNMFVATLFIIVRN